MEMILAPLDQSFGKDMWGQPETSTTTAVRLPSLFAHSTTAATSKERSPRLVGMSDVLNAQAVEARPLSPMNDIVASRLPSIGSMIRQKEIAANHAAVHADQSKHDAHDPVKTMSPAQKQCMDLYKQLRDTPSSPVDVSRPAHPEYALGNLLAGAALSQLALIQQAKEADGQLRGREKMRTILPAINTSLPSESSDKVKRSNSAKLCGMNDCRKRAKAGGYCIAHGGGLRCSEEGCQKHAVSLGLCISHGGGKRCTVNGCLNASRKNGVCWSHGGKRLCKLEGCNKGPKSGGYCWSHGGKLKK